MALFLTREEANFQWHIWKMDESLEELCALLSPEVVGEANRRFSSPHRRQEWLSVRALLAQCAGNEAHIGYLPSGKPFVTGSPFPYIGISHTRGYVTVILGNRPVSIDIEQYGPRVHKVASKFMRDDERPGMWQGDDTWGMLLHWSAKETMYKYMEVEEVDFREHLHIFPFEVRQEGAFRACECRTSLHNNFLIHYLLHPDFVLTWLVGEQELCLD